MNIKPIIFGVKSFVIDYAPEILLGVGAASGVGAVGLAIYKARSKDNDNIRAEHAYSLNCIMADDPNKKALKLKAHAKMVGKFVKLYSGPAILEVLSITSFCASYGILHSRYAAASALASALQAKLESIEDHTPNDKGEIVEDDIVLKGDVPEDMHDDPYAFIFDEHCREWGDTRSWDWQSGRPEFDADTIDSINFFNRRFVEEAARHWNDMLNSRTSYRKDGSVRKNGRVYLNEVRRYFGVNHIGDDGYLFDDPDNELGWICGWENGRNDNVELTYEVIPADSPEELDTYVIHPNCCGLINHMPGLKLTTG